MSELPAKKSPLLCSVLAVLIASGCAIACNERRAKKQRADDTLNAFVVERGDGGRSLVLLENVTIHGGKGSRAGYYRLQAIDLQSGDRKAREVIEHSHKNHGFSCAPGPQGFFWCLQPQAAALSMRDPRTLEVVKDLAALKKSASILADGIYEVAADARAGELLVTTGKGDRWILRGAAPEAVPYEPAEKDGPRYVAMNNAPTRESQTSETPSLSTAVGKLLFRSHEEHRDLILHTEPPHEDRALEFKNLQYPGFLLDHRRREPVQQQDAQIAVFKHSKKQSLIFVGVGFAGEERWVLKEAAGSLFRAYQFDDQVVVVARQHRGSYVVSFSLVDGSVHWRKRL